jgi:hypothetical protein
MKYFFGDYKKCLMLQPISIKLRADVQNVAKNILQKVTEQ